MNKHFENPIYSNLKWEEITSFSWFVHNDVQFYLHSQDDTFLSWLPVKNGDPNRHFVYSELTGDNKYLIKIYHWSDGAQIWNKVGSKHNRK